MHQELPLRKENLLCMQSLLIILAMRLGGSTGKRERERERERQYTKRKEGEWKVKMMRKRLIGSGRKKERSQQSHSTWHINGLITGSSAVLSASAERDAQKGIRGYGRYT